jgi:UDP-glucose 4-epimerase
MTIRALAGSPPVIFGDGSQTRDFTFVTDTVAGLIAACESDAVLGQAVNIAFGREVSISRIAELVCETCGTDVAPVHTAARPADVDRHYADVSKARNELAFEAGVPIEEGIARYVEWFRERNPDPGALLAKDVERNWETAAQ